MVEKAYHQKLIDGRLFFRLCLPVSFSRREKQENHQLCWWLTRLLASIYFSQYNLIIQVRQRRKNKWPKAVTVYH
ncbi:UNVERIFIED_CONTAM: hypothetical protein KB579_10855, partial [Streptococcus canis]